MTAVAPDDAPFVGPRPFAAAESDVFFGCYREVEQLTSIVISHPAVLLYSVSGGGQDLAPVGGTLCPRSKRRASTCAQLRGERRSRRPPASPTPTCGLRCGGWG